MTPKEIEAERELFEAWALIQWPDDPGTIRRGDHIGEYVSYVVEEMWVAWLARASIRPAQAAEPSVWPKVTLTAPSQIWLQVSDDVAGMDEPFPTGAEGVTWERGSVLACEVPYVRADLAAPQQAAEERKPLSAAATESLLHASWTEAEKETRNGEPAETEWIRYGMHILRAVAHGIKGD